MSRSVALVTCRELPSLERDDLPLVAALKDLRCEVAVTIWDDLLVQWAQFDAIVLRSPIDYVHRLPEFLHWASSVARLHNTVPMVRWNTDKSYLGELDAAGIRVIATRWLPPGEPLRAAPDGPFVIKPSVGVGGECVRRYDPRELADAAAHVRRLHERGLSTLLQPYLDSIEHAGETSLVYFGTSYSHAVRRRGFMRDGSLAEPGYRPSVLQAQLADDVIAHLTGRFGAPLYARIDLLETPDGPVVNEVEVTDPVLHLRGELAGAPRFAHTLLERMP